MRKKILLIIFALLIPSVGLGAGLDDFVITVKTDNTGTSLPNQFTIPTRFTSGFSYNYNVDCDNDGTDEFTAQTGDVTCDYTALGGVGTYTIRIEDNSGTGGGFHRIYFNNGGDRLKILSVDQWGTGTWSDMQDAFETASNLSVTATDAPDLSLATNLLGMFDDSGITTEDFSSWDVSTITNFGNLFKDTNFNGDITTWDTGEAISMSSMFSDAALFNQNIGNWNTSNVLNMSSMFSEAKDFNQDISTKIGAGVGGGDAWDMSSVTTVSRMFSKAEDFNQDIGDWDTSKVTNMSSLFSGALVFNQDIGNWDTSKVTNMSSLFNGALDFNQDIGDWDTGAVTNMNLLFANAEEFNQDIGNWDTSKVTNMSNLFSGASLFNQDIGSWVTSSTTNMERLFANTEDFNQDIGNWDVSLVRFMSSMFDEANSFDQDIGDWDVSSVEFINSMFESSPGLSTVNYDSLLAGWSSRDLNSGLSFDAGGSTYCYSDTERASMTDPVGDNWTITDGGIDCVPENPAAAPDLVAASDTGTSSVDNITLDTTPTFDVQCSRIGNTLAFVSDNGSATSSIATHVCAATGTVQVTSSVLAEDTYDITYNETATPKSAPNVSGFSPALSITIDTTAPNDPAIAPDLQAGSDTGTSTDNITTDNRPDFDIPCTEIGSTITLLVDGSANGTNVCSAVTTESISVATVIPDGTVSVTFTETDIAGNQSGASPALSVTIDTSEIDDDGDSLDNGVENDGPNGGDGDDDGTLDSAQAHVSSLVNDVTGEYITLKADQGGTTCDTISAIDVLAESGLTEQDNSFSYPIGLVDFDITCSNPGDSVDLTFFLDKEYDTSTWVQKKYDSTSDTYSDLNATTTYGTADIGGTMVTTISYTITDGGPDDEDGLANGVIVDPSGPALPPVVNNDNDNNNRSSGGGRVYSCKDREAINYRYYGVEDNRKCKYAADNSELIQDLMRQLDELEELLRKAQLQTTNQTCTSFTKYMKKGDSDNILGVAEVTKLQNTLKQLGLYDGPVTGYFGPLTEQAVKTWQTKHKQEVLTPWGLTKASGWFYKSSLKKMNELICSN